ncbi:MAG: NAD-dependent epimerase/dehydratase family protein [Terrimicrobiaceae bacterium]
MKTAPPLPAADLDHILTHTRRYWEELRHSRIFVTGGTGFFGCWLVESFCHADNELDLGAELVVLTRNPAGFREKLPHLATRKGLILHEGDVRDFPFPAGAFTHIIHGATTSSAPVAPAVMLQTITSGTRRVLDFAATCGAKKLLYVSSGAVYGRQPPDLPSIPETHTGAPDPTNTESAYGEGKRLGELLCVLAQEQFGLETKIARCFAFVGPHLPLNAHFAMGNFLRDAIAGSPIRVSGDGTPVRSYLHAADLAVWLWTILFQGSPARAYNVGGGEAVALGELATLVDRSGPHPQGVQMATRPADHSLPSRYVPDISRANEELGLRQLVPLEDAIKRTVRWLTTNS